MRKKLRILAAGDLHGSEAIAESLARKAQKNKVDLVVLAGDLSNPFQRESVISPFKKRNLETVFVPGNWEMDLDVEFINRMYGLKNLDGYHFQKSNVDFFGIGNPNFRLDHHKTKDFDKMKKVFDKIKSNPTKKVLVSHLHAAGSSAEFSGFPGSYALRKAIEEFKPDIVISSHIHEAEGMEEKINQTKVFQVGSKGKIIEI